MGSRLLSRTVLLGFAVLTCVALLAMRSRRSPAAAAHAGTASFASASSALPSLPIVASSHAVDWGSLMSEPKHDLSGYSVSLACPSQAARTAADAREQHEQDWFNQVVGKLRYVTKGSDSLHYLANWDYWTVEQYHEVVASQMAPITFAPGAKVFEVGCAAGAYLTALKKLHPQIGELYGVDLAPNLVEIAQRFAVPGDYCVADASDLSFVSSNSFDVVISNCVINYLPSLKAQVAAVRHMIRVAKPGAQLFIGMINDPLYWTLLDPETKFTGFAQLPKPIWTDGNWTQALGIERAHVVHTQRHLMPQRYHVHFVKRRS